MSSILSAQPTLVSRPTRLLLALVVILTALGEVSTQIYVPSLPAIAASFGTGKEVVQHTLTAFVIAFGLGQLVYGPLSDAFGRRRVLLAGLLLYLAATAACYLAESPQALIAARFMQGAGASAALVLARAITRDVWGVNAAPVMTLSTLALGLSVMLAPLVGGTLAALPTGWRTSFLFLLCVAGAVTALVWFGFRETHHERDPLAMRPKQLLTNYGELLRDRSYISFVLVLALTYGSLFAFISSAPLYIVGQMGLSSREYGLCFSAVASGLCAGMFTARLQLPRWGIVRTVWIGIAACLLAALSALALSSHPSLVSLLLPQLPLTFGAGLIIPATVAGAVIPQGRRAGLAAGLIGFLQMLGGALCGYLAVRFYAGSPVSMLVIQVIALTLALLVFFFGRRAKR